MTVEEVKIPNSFLKAFQINETAKVPQVLKQTIAKHQYELKSYKRQMEHVLEHVQDADFRIAQMDFLIRQIGARNRMIDCIRKELGLRVRYDY